MSRPSRSHRIAVASVLFVVVLAVGTVTTAERRALATESDYVSERLADADCLSDWGVNEGGGPSTSASVTGLTLGGLRVAVTLPYAYTVGTGEDRVFADTASRAVYEVTATGTHRVRGSDVDPC